MIEHILDNADKWVLRGAAAILMISFGVRFCTLILLEDIDKILRERLRIRRERKKEEA